MSYNSGPKIITNGITMYLDAKLLNSSNYNTFWKDLTSTYTITKLSPTSASPRINYMDGTYGFFNNGGFSTPFSWPNNFTVCMIIYPNTQATSLARVISTGPSDNFEFALGSAGVGLSVPSFYPNGSSAWETMGSGQYLTNGKFYHLTIVKSGSTFLFYINGAYSYGSTTNASAGSSLYYGTRYNSSEPSNTTISSFIVYNRALSAGEIVQNYNSMIPRLTGQFVASGTVLYGLCNEVENCWITQMRTNGIGGVDDTFSYYGGTGCGGGCPPTPP